MDKAAFLDFVVEIVKRSDTAQGFDFRALAEAIGRASISAGSPVSSGARAER
jgi:hypothetical protein